MGFFGNLADEAGTKTGKAITNKLFGKYANDLNIGMSFSDGGSDDDGKAQVKVEKEQTRRMLKAAEIEDRRIEQQKEEAKIERVEALKNELISLQLDPNDASGLTQKLLHLSSVVDSYSDDFKYKPAVELAKSKYETAIMMLKRTGEHSDMIPFFESKIGTWKAKEEAKALQVKNAQKMLVKVMIGLTILLVILITLGMIFGK